MVTNMSNHTICVDQSISAGADGGPCSWVCARFFEIAFFSAKISLNPKTYGVFKTGMVYKFALASIGINIEL